MIGHEIFVAKGGFDMKDEVIRIRIPGKDKETIRSIAQSKDMSMSEYILYILRKEMDKEQSRN